MSLPVIDSKLCRGTRARRRPIPGAARKTLNTPTSTTTAMRWPGTAKNMRAAALPNPAAATVTTVVAATQ